MNRARRHLTFANVVSLLALFVALGGTSYAVAKIDGKNIKSKSIAGTKLKSNTLTGKQIKESKLATVPSAQTALQLAGFDPSRVASANAVFATSRIWTPADNLIFSDPGTGLKVYGQPSSVETYFANTSSTKLDVKSWLQYSSGDSKLWRAQDLLDPGSSVKHIAEAVGTQHFHTTAYNYSAAKLVDVTCTFTDPGDGKEYWGCTGVRSP
jgi:hypothetical protein